MSETKTPHPLSIEERELRVNESLTPAEAGRAQTLPMSERFDEIERRFEIARDRWEATLKQVQEQRDELIGLLGRCMAQLDSNAQEMKKLAKLVKQMAAAESGIRLP